MPTDQTARTRYHHGDLAHALANAATQLARKGGPEAVVLREAARQVGVSATAAYRHFASHRDLIHAVKEQAKTALADAMQAELIALAPLPDPIADAEQRLRTLGTAYVHFALTEPGLFRTAFCRADQSPDQPADQPDDGAAEPWPVIDAFSVRAYQMLSAALDALAERGRIRPEHRPHAEIAAWAPMHGLALLILDGPLQALPPEERAAAIRQTADVVIAGICRP